MGPAKAISLRPCIMEYALWCVVSTYWCWFPWKKSAFTKCAPNSRHLAQEEKELQIWQWHRLYHRFNSSNRKQISKPDGKDNRKEPDSSVHNPLLTDGQMYQFLLRAHLLVKPPDQAGNNFTSAIVAKISSLPEVATNAICMNIILWACAKKKKDKAFWPQSLWTLLDHKINHILRWKLDL